MHEKYCLTDAGELCPAMLGASPDCMLWPSEKYPFCGKKLDFDKEAGQHIRHILCLKAENQLHGKKSDFLKRLQKEGISFTFTDAWYSWDIDISEIALLSRDRTALLCHLHGISREQYQNWLNMTEQCTGITRKGKRCKKLVQPYVDPKDFMPGISDRCFWHQDTT